MDKKTYFGSVGNANKPGSARRRMVGIIQSHLGKNYMRRHPNSSNRRARYVSIAGAFLWLSVFSFSCQAPQREQVSAPMPTADAAAVSPRQPHGTPDTRQSDFYRTIVDNTLGWRPPRPIEPYRRVKSTIPATSASPVLKCLSVSAEPLRCFQSRKQPTIARGSINGVLLMLNIKG